MKKILIVLVMMVFGCAGVLGQKYYNPTFNNGFQWELEGGPCSSLSVSYKFAKRFSIGAGYQYGICVNGFLNKTKRSVTIQRNYSSTYGKDKSPSTIHRSDDWIDGMNGPTDSKFQKYFVNLQIRPVNRVFSPILGINVGQMTIHLDDYWYPYYGDEQSMLTLTPYAGLSIRLGRNCFLGLKFGVDNLGSKIAPTGDQQVDKRTIYDHGTPNYYVETTITDFPDVDISNIYLALNFTHTMNFGHGYTEKRRIAEYRASHPKMKKERDGHVLDAIANALEVTSNALEETANTLNQMQGNNNVAVPNGNYSGIYNQNYSSGSYSGNNYYAGANNNQNTKIVHNYKNTFENDGQYTNTTFIPNHYTSKEVYNDGKCILYTDETSEHKIEWRVCQCDLCDNDGTFLLGGTKISCIHCKGRKFVVYKEIQDFKNGTRTFIGNEGITDIYNLYTNQVIYSGTDKYVREQKELTDFIKSQTEQRKEDSEFQREMREQERHDDLCNAKLRNYLKFSNMLLDMKTGSTPYSESRKQSLQSDMRRYRQECPDITKSDLEDW